MFSWICLFSSIHLNLWGKNSPLPVRRCCNHRHRGAGGDHDHDDDYDHDGDYYFHNYDDDRPHQGANIDCDEGGLTHHDYDDIYV